MTAQIVVYLLRFSGVPVFLDGYYIEIPSASFLVAESCSGVRYLMVCIALGLLTAHLFFRSWPRRVLFVALATVVPIAANGIRAYSIVMIAYSGRQEFAIHFDHVIYGFAFLSVVTLSLLGLGALLRGGDLSSLRGAANPVVSDRTSGGFETVTLGRSVQVLCAVLAVGIVISVQIWTEAAKAPPPSLGVVLHAPVAGYHWTPDGEAPAWTPKFHGTDAKLQQSYSRGKERVDLYVGYYAYQREGAEAVSDLNTISSRSEVKVLSSKRIMVRIADVSLPINELAILHRSQPFLLWYWYWIGGENTNSRFAAKLLEMKALATGGERAAAIVAVSAEVSENVEGAGNLINSFLQESLGSNGAPFELETSSPRAVVGEPQSPPDQAGRAVNP
jgi:EpsI family protein